MSEQWNIGKVNKFPRIKLNLQEPRIAVIDFVVDTGFDGELSVPNHIAARFDREPDDSRTMMLANGQEITCPLYEVDISWDDELRRVGVLVLDGNPLLGIELLDGYRLIVDMQDDGDVYLELI